MILVLVCRKGHRASFRGKLPPCVSLNLPAVTPALIVPGPSGTSYGRSEPPPRGGGTFGTAHRRGSCPKRTTGYRGSADRATVHRVSSRPRTRRGGADRPRGLTSLHTSIVPNTTWSPSKKLSPMMITVAPPVVQPSLGLMALMHGVAARTRQRTQTLEPGPPPPPLCPPPATPGAAQREAAGPPGGPAKGDRSSAC